MAPYLDVNLCRRNYYLICSLNNTIILIGSYQNPIINWVPFNMLVINVYDILIVNYCFFLFTYTVYYLFHHDKIIIVYTAQGMLLFPLQ